MFALERVEVEHQTRVRGESESESDRNGKFNMK